MRLPIEAVSDRRHLERAWERSRPYDNHLVYDMIHAATAEAAGTQFITADETLLVRLGRLGWVRQPGTSIAESDVENLHRQALATPELQRRLRLAAHWTRRQFELGYDIISTYQEAARADPRVALVWRRVMLRREAAVSELLESLKGRLRSGLRLRQAHLYVSGRFPMSTGLSCSNVAGRAIDTNTCSLSS